MALRDLLSRPRWTRRRHAAPDGQRWYAIGDVHGCCDVLNTLIRVIDGDDEQRGATDTRLLFLGDYIDRGPNSRGVIELMMKLDLGDDKVVFLMGNHEEVLLAAAEGNRRAAALFHKMGGRETLLSYGVSAQDYDYADTSGIVDMIRAAIPRDHLEWLAGLRNAYRAGDYFFVHAGVRPGIPLDDQASSDLRWIRGEFLSHPASHGPLVVHGHSMSPSIDERPNRIGIDTGAYASGCLTALGIEGEERWYIQTGTPQP
ncbi:MULTISPECIES: metallophosphoesterase family protein [unclassified Sphingomonas]|uniref:metallophosphoesterase family protein n=1 Tax=unclassified Sphingomonas TaxID=196159 RepID=UPI0006F36D7E|nr:MULTISPECIES: metallophosphoesterase family protein [unclassified Sphingomonas]KQX19526.1 metallophosphoesterase [Sphingomonas sp. Root1294]KQY65727.1 metallophosphoesterase [Sphingomonas sp. Root50]KRB94968.1 metallophosphoesterase [Sphingomonas sp. Root720]